MGKNDRFNFLRTSFVNVAIWQHQEIKGQVCTSEPKSVRDIIKHQQMVEASSTEMGEEKFFVIQVIF